MPNPFIDIFKFAELSVDTTDVRRIYRNDSGDEFLSMTSFLGQLDDNPDWYEAWANRIGHDEAARITSEAGEFGTEMHEHIEVLLKESCAPDSPVKKSIRAAEEVYAYLQDKYYVLNPDKLRVIEQQVFSSRLKLAGRLDAALTRRSNNAVTIIDFKGSRKAKAEKWIGNYFLQVFGYTACLKNMIQDAFAVPDHGLPLTLEEAIELYVPTEFEIIVYNRADEMKYEQPGLQFFRGTISDIKPDFMRAYNMWKMKSAHNIPDAWKTK